MTTKHVIEGIFAAGDSDKEQSDKEKSNTQERNEPVQENVYREPSARGSGCVFGHGIRTRGGVGNNHPRLAAKAIDKANKKAEFETKWKREDHPPHIAYFTAESKINVDLPEETTEINFLDLFLDEEFFTMLTAQTNLYAVQYRVFESQVLEAGPLISYILKPEISQYWSTDSL